MDRTEQNSYMMDRGQLNQLSMKEPSLQQSKQDQGNPAVYLHRHALHNPSTQQQVGPLQVPEMSL